MNQNENQNLPPEHYVEDDEINLLDLFVVLLKYRKLIIGVVLFVVIVAAAGYFLYPQYQYQQALEKQQMETTLPFFYTPVVSLIGVQGQIRPTIQQAPLLLEALQQAGYKTFGYGREDVEDNNTVDITKSENRSTALYLVRQKLIEDKDAQGNEYESGEKAFNISQSGNEIELLYRNSE